MSMQFRVFLSVWPFVFLKTIFEIRFDLYEVISTIGDKQLVTICNNLL